MPNYQPFLISDLTEGKVTRRDRWLLSPDGFGTLDNCGLKRGVLEKRRGKSKLGQIVKIDTATQNPTLQTNPIMGVYNHRSGSTENLIVFDKERMNTFVSNKVSGVILLSVADVGGAPNVVRFTIATGHGLAADDIVTISNTTNYNGTFRVEAIAATTFDIESAFVAETMGVTSQANQEQFTDASMHRIRFDFTLQSGYTPANGDTIEQAVSGATGVVDSVTVDYGTFGNNDAVGTIIFQDGTITGTFVVSEQLFESGTPANIVGDSTTAGNDSNWTGDNTDFFWIENWDLGGAPKTYITNNKDPLEIYDGANLTQFSIDIGLAEDRTGQNDVNSALLVFVIKERIVIFNTNENGTDYNQRARWSAIKEPQSWPLSSFIDAPTDDIIVTADLLGDDLYVWFKGGSVWRFVYTGDSVSPFEWQRVSAQDGAIAQMSLTTRNNLQRAISGTEILGNNGNIVSHIDQKIPDVVLEWNPDSAAFSVSEVLEEEKQIYFTYARVETVANADGNKYPDRALILDYEDNSWATCRHEIHSMGSSKLESDITWDLDEAWEDIDFAWNQLNTVSGFPFTIIGDHSGLLFAISTGGSDAGEAIEFNAATARFNPYSKQGMKAKCWKVEVLCDVNEDVSFDVELFLNTDTTKYSTTTITCSAVDGSDDKAWFAAYSGAVGTFHSANITNNASGNRPRIHAMRWWFKPAGRVK